MNKATEIAARAHAGQTDNLRYGAKFGGELIRYGFEDLKFVRVQASCAAENYGFFRVMERNGLCREALHRKAFWSRTGKEWIDEVVYPLIAVDDYAKRQRG